MGLREGAHTLFGAKNVVPQRMPLEEHVLELVEDELRRCVVIAFYLLADHRLLAFEFGFRIFAAEHDVGEQVDGAPYMLVEDGSIIGRGLLCRESVEVASHALQVVDDLHGRAVTGALEGHVFAEVGKSFLARQLVASAGSNLIAAIEDA